MMKYLKLFRLLDANNQLSLTNIAMMAGIINLLLHKDVATQDMLMFVASMVGYQVKRFANNPNAQTDVSLEEINKAIAQLETKVTAIQVGNSLKPRR